MTIANAVPELSAVDEIVEILEDRHSTYGFLSQVYQAELPAVVLEPVLRTLSQPAPMAADAGPESPGQALLHDFAVRVQGTDIAQVAADLAAEYVAIFFVSWRRRVAPYESVYTSKDHAMMQEASLELAALYTRKGLLKDERFVEPADHIALELAFMAFLCKQALDAARVGNAAKVRDSLTEQAQFLRLHLLNWIPAFCRDLEQTTTSDFYRGIAKLTAEHLATEAATLDELMRA